MKIEEVIAKLLKGEALSEEEKTFADGYKSDGGDGGAQRVPKSRLDEEIAKRKAAEQKAADNESRLQELSDQIEELKQSGMTEAEKAKAETQRQLDRLNKQVASLTKERDEAKAKSEAMEFDGKVAALASRHGVRDAEYLGHKLKAAKVSLDDADAADGFVRELEKGAPWLFQSQAKGGGGTGGGTQGAGGATSSFQSRIDELLRKPSLTMRESQEVIDLKGKMDEAAKTGGAGAPAGGNGNQNGGSAQGAATA